MMNDIAAAEILVHGPTHQGRCLKRKIFKENNERDTLPICDLKKVDTNLCEIHTEPVILQEGLLTLLLETAFKFSLIIHVEVFIQSVTSI